MLKSLRKNILFTIIFAVSVYAGIFIYSDFTHLHATLENYPISNIGIALFLVLLSIAAKYLRWHYFLNALSINLTIPDSILYFLMGLIMGVTPGKLGEFIKSFLIKKNYKIQISKTAPVIFAERIFEFGTLIFLIVFGSLTYGIGFWYVVALAVFFLITLFFLTNRNFYGIISTGILKFSRLEGKISDIQIFNESLRYLFGSKRLLTAFFISLLAWILEFTAFFAVIMFFSDKISVFFSSFVYGFSIILGAISLLPGGIGLTEGALSYMLVMFDFTESSAIASTLLIRVLTLWFTVILGIFSFFLYIVKKVSKH